MMAGPANENDPEPIHGSYAHFVELGASLMKRHPCDSDTTSFQERWVTHFQVAPEVVLIIWRMIAMWNDYGIEPLHLMGALLFLKIYPFEAVFSSLFGNDEDTNRKWLWRTIEVIADLETDIVSCFDVVWLIAVLNLFLLIFAHFACHCRFFGGIENYWILVGTVWSTTTT
jgi:hypothetical protein